MGWKEAEPKKIEYNLEELLRKEKHWDSPYFEPDRWKRDFESCYYFLAGEYEVDADSILLRFELDESKRDLLMPGAAHFHNVLLHPSKAKTDGKKAV